MIQQKQNQFYGQENNNKNKILEQDKTEMSFGDVHRLIAEEKKRFDDFNGERVNDAEL